MNKKAENEKNDKGLIFIINNLNSITNNKWIIILVYSILLLFQYYIIYIITWRIDSIYFVNLTFSLLLLFVIFSSIIVSLLLSILILWYTFFLNWAYILFYITLWIGLGFLIILIYEYIYRYHNKHINKLANISNIFINLYLKLLIFIWICFYLYSFNIFINTLINSPKNVLVENDKWLNEYKLRFYNINYYFLENNSWSVIIYNSSSIKSIEFK